MTSADEAHDGRGHDADRACASDQHILADDIEGECRVNRIAERIEDRRDLVIDCVGELECVQRGNDHVLGKAAGPIHADADRIATEMSSTRATVAAMTAGDMAFTRHAIAWLEARDLTADFHDLAAVFVTYRHRDGDGALGPAVPVVDVHVGAADRGALHANQNVVVADGRSRDVLQFDAGSSVRFDEGVHIGKVMKVME